VLARSIGTSGPKWGQVEECLETVLEKDHLLLSDVPDHGDLTNNDVHLSPQLTQCLHQLLRVTMYAHPATIHKYLSITVGRNSLETTVQFLFVKSALSPEIRRRLK